VDPGRGREWKGRAELVAVGARMARLGLVRAGEGNFSLRLDRESFLLTPRGVEKGHLAPWQLLRVSLQGPLPAEASSEGLLHQRVLQRHPQVGAVVHAHPEALLALLHQGKTPDPRLLREAESSLHLATLPDLPPGSRELAEAAAEAADKANVLLLPRHGAVALGPQALDALHLLEVLELLARMLLAQKG